LITGIGSPPVIGSLDLLAQAYQPVCGGGDVLLYRAAGELGDKSRQQQALRVDDIL